MASEKKILNDSLVATSALPRTFCWRNNTGMAWQSNEVVKRPVGSFVQVEPGMVILRNARPVTFGLPGSGDILGVTLAPCGHGVAWSVETKTSTGRQSSQQGNFGRAWQGVGGRYTLARSVDEALSIPQAILRGE